MKDWKSVHLCCRFFVAFKETPESQGWVTDLKAIQMRYIKWERSMHLGHAHAQGHRFRRRGWDIITQYCIIKIQFTIVHYRESMWCLKDLVCLGCSLHAPLCSGHPDDQSRVLWFHHRTLHRPPRFPQIGERLSERTQQPNKDKYSCNSEPL